MAAPEKLPYVEPQIVDLGPVEELTQATAFASGSQAGKKPFGTVDGPHGPKPH
jgi:hypothetical protein